MKNSNNQGNKQRKSVQVRKSTFIYSNGPGSIIEGPSGFSRIVPLLHTGLGIYWRENIFNNSRIENPRLENLIKTYVGCSNPGIMELPSNIPIYHTKKFPEWKICYNTKEHEKHEVNVPVLYKGEYCPLCGKIDKSSSVRFVMACSSGHLSDVNWNFAVHYKKKCDGEYYLWKPGNTLSDIKITCCKCSSHTDMNRIYGIPFPCTGDLLEKENKENCDKKMWVAQRNSTSLYIPVTMALLKTDEEEGLVSAVNAISQTLDTIIMMDKNIPIDEEGTKDLIINIVNNNTKISDSNKKIIIDYLEENIVSNLINFYQSIKDQTKEEFIQYIYKEFEFLEKTVNGEEPMELQLDANTNAHLKVYPVNALTVDTVNLGYMRIMDKDEAHHVYVGSKLDSGETITVFPGIENSGEGILITTNDIPNLNKYLELWKLDEKDNNLQSKMWKDMISPSFVWLHTLSHAIMLEISIFDGYSSASVRERIYMKPGSRAGGILLYTSAYGNGAMGGLSGITLSDMKIILGRALSRVEICSNDPVCLNERKKLDGYNGAACFSCIMVPETSCEHGNKYLDRHILLGD